MPWGVRRDVILKVDYILLVTAVATGRNRKDILYVLPALHGKEVNIRTVIGITSGTMSLRVSKDKHLRKACGKYGSDWLGKTLNTDFRTFTLVCFELEQ